MEASAATTQAPQTGQENPAVNDLLQFAQALRDEKALIYAKIEANRSILRGYKVQGLLSEEQSKAIDAFYPPVTKKDKKDENESKPAPAKKS